MAGKHRASGGGSGGNLVAAGLAVVVVAGAGYAGFRLFGGSDDSEQAGASSPAAVSSAGSTPTAQGESSSAATEASSSSASSSSSPSTSSSSSSSSGGGGLPAGCKEQLKAGAKAISAADRSYGHWHGHTQADLDYRSGKNTWAKTKKIWGETKKTGDADVADFRKADATYTKAAKGGCRSVERDGARQDVTRCLDRFAKVDAAVGAGRKVNDDWNRHVQMMKHKDHTDPKVYLKQWRSMVDGAAPNQKAYTAARGAFAKAPPCAT